MKVKKFPNADGDVFFDQNDVLHCEVSARPDGKDDPQAPAINLMRVRIVFKTEGKKPLVFVVRKTHANALLDALNAGGTTIP